MQRYQKPLQRLDYYHLRDASALLNAQNALHDRSYLGTSLFYITKEQSPAIHRRLVSGYKQPHES